MIVEFEKRVAALTQQMIDERQSQPVNEKEIARLEGALAEAERLYAFYREQMVAKDRIIPHNYREG